MNYGWATEWIGLDWANSLIKRARLDQVHLFTGWVGLWAT